jgi:phytoene dehydrogenase-like protein
MTEPGTDDYDAVVIGAGLGGLSAGACLAKAGKRVLVVERQDAPGGNAHVFRRGPYVFDPAIHVTGQGFNVPFLDFYLGALGVAGDLELVTAEEFGTVVVDGARFTAPNGVDAFTEFMSEQFPAEGEGIRAFIDVCASATRESQAPPPKVAVQDLGAMIEALPTLFKYRTRTLADALDEFISDPQAKTVLSGWWPYLGLPPSKLSFMAYSGALMALVDHGPQYPKGSFQRLADGLAGAIEANGGELVYGRTVTSVEVTDGNATGVVLDDDGRVAAPVVISNADAVQTFE